MSEFLPERRVTWWITPGVSLIIFFQNKEDHDFYQKAEKHLQFIERNQSIWQRVQVYDMIQNNGRLGSALAQPKSSPDALQKIPRL